jgi:mycofactocin precursor
MTRPDTAREPAPDGPEATMPRVDAERPDDAPADAAATTLVEADLLVEDVSIDGMCGVY